MVWFRRNVARLGFVGFVLMLVVSLAVPEDAYGIGCGGGLFGGRARRQARRSSRVEIRQARFGAAGCSGAALSCAGRVEHVHQAPVHYQAPAHQAPAKSVCPTCPANQKVEFDYPQAEAEVVKEEEFFISVELTDIEWDKVPEGAIEIPQW